MTRFCSKCGKMLSENEKCNCCNQETEPITIQEKDKKKYELSKYIKKVVKKDEEEKEEDNDNDDKDKKDKKALEEDKDKIIEELWNGELVEKKRFDFNMCIMDTFEDIALIIKNPVLGARIYLEKDEYYNSICMVLIQAIVSAALVMIYLFALNINLDDKNLKFSIFAGFVYTLLLSLAYTILFILLLYGVSYCFKAGISLKKSLEIVSIKSVPIFAVDTLACFLIIFSIKFGIWLFILSSLIGCLYVIFAYSTEVSINMDKRLFIILITMVVIYTLFAIFFKSIINLYLPESMSKQVEDILSVIKNIAN